MDAAQRRRAVFVQLRLLLGFQPRDAEIGHLHAALPVHEDVLGLDVAMDDAVSMGVIHRGEDADGHAQRLIRRDAAFFPDQLLERLTVHELHDDVAHLAVDTHVQHVHDVLVRDLAGRLGFAAEPAHELLIGFVLRPEHLDGHSSFSNFVVGPIDHRHAAGSNDGFDDVSVRERAADHRRSSSVKTAMAVMLSCPPASSAACTSAWTMLSPS